MKRVFKYFTIFCVCALVLSVAPFTPASATEEEISDTITRAQWLSRLVNTFGYTADDELLPDIYYPDLNPDAEYCRDVLVAVYYGLVDLPANTQLEPDVPATRSFAAHTLNHCMGYLPDQEPVFSEGPQIQ